MVYRWTIIIVLTIVAAALMAGPNFGDFLAHAAGILVLGFILRELDKAKKSKDQKGRDKE